MNTGAPSRSSAMSPRWRGGEGVEVGGLAALTQRQTWKRARLEIDRQVVFGGEPLLEHVELQRADDADDRRRAVERQEHLDHALLGHLLQRLAELLGLHGVLDADAAQDFRREARHAAEGQGLALGQRVADAQRAVIGDADDVAGEGLVGDGAVLGEEELRRVEADRLAGAHELRLHAARQPARADAHEGDAVAVVRVHVRLDLEDEAGHRRLVRRRPAAPRPCAAPAAARCSASRSIRSRTPKLRSALPKSTGVRWPSRNDVEVERPAGRLGERDLLGGRRRGRLPAGSRRRPPARASRPAAAPSSSASMRRTAFCLEVVDAGEGAARADRPGERRGVERQRLLDLVEQVERVARPRGPSC